MREGYRSAHSRSNSSPPVSVFDRTQRSAQHRQAGNELRTIASSSLSHVASVAERVPAGLRPDRHAVRLAANGNSVNQLASSRIKYINLRVVATGNPKLFSIGRDISHVWTSATGNRPIRNDF